VPPTVFTESSVETEGALETVMVAGLKLQLAFAGRLEHERVTDPEKPAEPDTLIGALTA
jgi:hypothetical protein